MGWALMEGYLTHICTVNLFFSCPKSTFWEEPAECLCAEERRRSLHSQAWSFLGRNACQSRQPISKTLISKFKVQLKNPPVTMLFHSEQHHFWDASYGHPQVSVTTCVRGCKQCLQKQNKAGHLLTSLIKSSWRKLMHCDVARVYCEVSRSSEDAQWGVACVQ